MKNKSYNDNMIEIKYLDNIIQIIDLESNNAFINDLISVFMNTQYSTGEGDAEYCLLNWLKKQPYIKITNFDIPNYSDIPKEAVF